MEKCMFDNNNNAKSKREEYKKKKSLLECQFKIIMTIES